MAIQGKKINELDSISTVTDATVFPAVRVEGSTPSSTATKVSISQLKENLQEDIYTKEQVETLVGQKQDTLTAGANITIEEDSDENLVISADVDPLPSQTGNSGKFLTTNGTTASWDAALQNKATGSSSLTILASEYSQTGGTSSTGAINLGDNTTVGDMSVSIGYGSSTDDCSVAIGMSSQTGDEFGTAIGYGADAEGTYSIQIGPGTNLDAHTLSIGLDEDVNYQLLNSSGKIPMARLPIVQCTQAEYDALVSGGTVDANTLYLIIESSN